MQSPGGATWRPADTGEKAAPSRRTLSMLSIQMTSVTLATEHESCGSLAGVLRESGGSLAGVLRESCGSLGDFFPLCLKPDGAMLLLRGRPFPNYSVRRRAPLPGPAAGESSSAAAARRVGRWGESAVA